MTPRANSPSLTSAGADDSVAAEVEHVVRHHPWIETTMRLGWYAKGLIYLLMGAVGAAFTWRPRTDEQASPEGALGLVAAQPGGRSLLATFGIGLLLYVAWRVCSVAAIRGSSPKDNLRRVGYVSSAVFYTFLARTALQSALSGVDPDDSHAVERLSRSLMSQAWGRVALVIVGAVTVGIGFYFIIKAVTREYVDNLEGVRPTWRENHGRARAVFVAGMVGWFGRGVVMTLVGFFVGRAAWRFDPADAAGFDRALRRVAEASYGPPMLLVAAWGLIGYGVYCLLSAPHRKIAETPT